MLNLSLDQFYFKIYKRIKLISAYLEDKSYPFIIKSCRLKPLSAFGDQFKFRKVNFEKSWVDEFGHHLEINKGKAEIKYRKNNYISTDLYKFETISFLLHNSKLICLRLHKDDGGFILSLLGNDDYFRTYDEELNIVSSLRLGLSFLKEISRSVKLKNFKELEISGEKYYIARLPMSKLFLDNIENEKVKEILNGKR